MLLKNKKTGETATLTLSSNGEELLLMKNNEMISRNVKLSELKEWEDYEEPKGIQCIYYASNFQGSKATGVFIGYATKEEAEKAVEKLKAFKRLKDKGFRFTGVEDVERAIRFEIPFRAGYDSCEAEADLNLLFGGEE